MPGPRNFEQADVCWELTLALTGRNKLQLMVEKTSGYIQQQTVSTEHAIWGLPVNALSAVLSAISMCCHLSG